VPLSHPSKQGIITYIVPGVEHRSMHEDNTGRPQGRPSMGVRILLALLITMASITFALVVLASVHTNAHAATTIYEAGVPSPGSMELIPGAWPLTIMATSWSLCPNAIQHPFVTLFKSAASSNTATRAFPTIPPLPRFCRADRILQPRLPHSRRQWNYLVYRTNDQLHRRT